MNTTTTTTTTSAIATATPSSQILEHTAAFISETLSQIDLRQRLYSTLRCKLPSSLQTSLKPINLAAETLESAISTASPSIRSFSLRRAEKLILSHPPNPFSSLLLSLIYGLSRRPLDASLSLLDLFQTDPSSARSEIAPLIFQELFLVHLLPVLQSLNQQRLLILSSSPPNGDDDKDEYSICDESVVISCTKSLSKMSDDQASELKELETRYEAVVDENCKNLAKYFRQVLENKNGNELMNPPPVMLNKTEKFRMVEYTREQRIGTGEELGFKNGRQYGLMEKGQLNFWAPAAAEKSSLHHFTLKECLLIF